MARLHAILFVIRMCGCWMLLLYISISLLISTSLILWSSSQVRKTFNSPLAPEAVEVARKFTFLSENMKKLHTDGMSVRKEKRSLCVVLKMLFLSVVQTVSSLQVCKRRCLPQKKLLNWNHKSKFFLSWTRQNHKIILKVSSGWWIKKKN